MKTKVHHNRWQGVVPLFLAIIFFASSLTAEAFLGSTRAEVKERLGDPVTGTIKEINAVIYEAGSYAYIIRFDAAGSVDRCMITKMTDVDSFTAQEFSALTKSISAEGFKTLKSNGDECLMLNHATKDTYFAKRSGARKEWIVMTTYKAGQQPDLSFFKAVMRLLKSGR